MNEFVLENSERFQAGMSLYKKSDRQSWIGGLFQGYAVFSDSRNLSEIMAINSELVGFPFEVLML